MSRFSAGVAKRTGRRDGVAAFGGGEIILHFRLFWRIGYLSMTENPRFALIQIKISFRPTEDPHEKNIEFRLDADQGVGAALPLGEYRALWRGSSLR